MYESTFRKNLVSALNKVGCYAIPIESATSPGFPDIVLGHWATALIECKVISSAMSQREFGKIFERNQLAFYHRWWRTQANNLWCAVYVEKMKRAHAFRLHPADFAQSISDAVATRFSGSVGDVAAYIGGNT